MADDVGYKSCGEITHTGYNMKKAVTDLDLRRWVKAGHPLSAKACGGGLYFRIHQSLAVQFYFRYQFGGKAKSLFLGNYPDMTLAAAHALARSARVDLDKGVDVARERQKAKAAARTVKAFEEVAREWLEREVETRYQHPSVVERVLVKDVFPKIGSKPVEDVTAGDVDDVLRKIVSRGAPTIANDALRHMKRVFTYARRHRLIGANPAADFTLADAGGPEKKRERALLSPELIALFEAMRATCNLGRENELTFKLLLALCVRKGELVKAKWEHFDLDEAVWHHPGGGARKGRPVDIPLAPQVIAWLRELKGFAGKSEYVLPARRVQSKGRRWPHISPDTLNVALARVQHGLEHFTVHDMRRTGRTHLSAVGVSRETAERTLNHAIKGSEGIYDRHDYFEERKVALRRWADLLEGYERGSGGNVVPMRRRSPNAQQAA